MIRISGLAAVLLGASAAGAALQNPFTESFGADNANWRNFNAGADLNWLPAGSFNGSSYVSGGFNFANSVVDDTPVIFRGQDEFGHSGGAFDGDYIAGGVAEFSAFVRHNAPVPLNFFARFSGPGNFPGATAISFIPVQPNTWTPIIIDISSTSPQFVSFENTDYETVFGANPLNGFAGIGHVQVGVSVTNAIEGFDQELTFDIDDISITPTPATLLALGGLVALRRRRG